jgi:hypothetical protein
VDREVFEYLTDESGYLYDTTASPKDGLGKVILCFFLILFRQFLLERLSCPSKYPQKSALTYYSRETRVAFETLITAKDLHSNELKSIQTSLDGGVKLSNAAVIQIRALFSPNDRQIQAANQRAILEALRFDMMDKRNDDISDASTETFEWILNDDDNDVQERSNPRLQCTFKDWLTSSGGIFHISGKPGAGKSTLMKFLCDHEKTKQQLQQWAGQKTLVFGKFYFWKFGTERQKNLDGLVRSLLFHILRNSPEFTIDLFPTHWAPDDYRISTSEPKIHINEIEIRQAFDKLIGNSATFANHRFCFFIDGLDEFEDKNDTWADLARRLITWVNGTDDVKICVSSREFETFESRFPANQRLRLQDLTRGDIGKVIQQKLEAARLDRQIYFQRLMKESPNASKKLETMVASKADGVFLWVTLTLKLLCLAFDNHESFSGLQKIIDGIPTELEEFFQYILDSIPKHDRQKAYCKLYFSLKFGFSTSLLQFAFFDRYLENNKFARNQEIEDLDDSEIENLLTAARAQVTGQCRGLLEIRPSNFESHESFEHDLVLKEQVRFIHRSIPEFLQKHLPIEDINLGEIYIETVLAIVKSVSFSNQNDIIEFLAILIFGAVLPRYCNTAPQFEHLYLLDKTLCSRYPELRTTDWTKAKAHFSSLDSRKLAISVPHSAALRGCHDYLEWGLSRFPEVLVGTSGAELILNAVWALMHNDDLREWVTALQLTLDVLFKLGLDPNCQSNRPQDCGLSIWGLCVLACTCDRSYKRFWPHLETFLKYGADIPSWFHSPGDSDKGKTSEIFITLGEKSFPLEELSESNPSWHRHQMKPLVFNPSSLPECLLAEGGRATLRNFFEKAFPESEVPAVLKTTTVPDITAAPAQLDGKGCQKTDTESFAPGAKYGNLPRLQGRFFRVLANPATPWILVGELRFSLFYVTRTRMYISDLKFGAPINML